MLCAFKAYINGLSVIWIPVHGLHINRLLKTQPCTFSSPASIAVLCLLGLKNIGPSTLNVERQNLLLCTSATAILFSYCNASEGTVCECYCCLMVRLKGSDENSITVACCCSQPMATNTHTCVHTQQCRSIHCQKITHTLDIMAIVH